MIEWFKKEIQARIDINEFFLKKDGRPSDLGRVEEDKFFLRLLELYEKKYDTGR